MKPIKLKELLISAKNPTEQKIEVLVPRVPVCELLFDGVVADVGADLENKILADWCVSKDGAYFIAFVV